MDVGASQQRRRNCGSTLIRIDTIGLYRYSASRGDGVPRITATAVADDSYATGKLSA
jgi:hypothetical protein